MLIKSQHCAMLATLALVVTGAAVALPQLFTPTDNDTMEVMFDASLLPQGHLYPPEPQIDHLATEAAARQAKAHPIMTCNGRLPPAVYYLPPLDRSTTDHKVRWIWARDGSFEKDIMQADDDYIATSQTYYPLVEGEGWHPHVFTAYAQNSNDVVTQETRSYSGLLQKVVQVGDDRRKHTVDYAKDGVTVLGDQWIQLPKREHDDQLLLSEERWRDDAEHSLAYTNLRHEDGTRTVTNWDADHTPLRVIDWAANDYVNGTKITGYYPGSRKIRLEGSSTWDYDTVSYHREDGSLSHIVVLSACTMEIKYFDNTGTKETLDQTFLRSDRVVDGTRKAVFVIQAMTEMDADGKEAEHYYFSDRKVSGYAKAGATVDGVTYKMVYFGFWHDKLNVVSYWTSNDVNRYPDTVDRDPKWSQDPPTVPPDKMRPLVELDDDLPVPPRQIDLHGS